MGIVRFEHGIFPQMAILRGKKMLKTVKSGGALFSDKP
jgi:hypothetical protein